MSRIQAPCLSVGISSDMLYPSYQQRQIVEMLGSVGVDAGYAEIDSPHGHDAFLLNVDQLARPVADFLECRKLP
jgi:homoserine O-acetyltransferase